jgi:hypothetical protein
MSASELLVTMSLSLLLWDFIFVVVCCYLFVLEGKVWVAETDLKFTIPPQLPHARIAEVHYHAW